MQTVVDSLLYYLQLLIDRNSHEKPTGNTLSIYSQTIENTCAVLPIPSGIKPMKISTMEFFLSILSDFKKL